MKKALISTSDWLNKVASIITAVLLALNCLLIFVSVIARFVFNSPISWQYEMTLFMLMWTIFLGMSTTFHAEEHMRLVFIINIFKGKGRTIWLGILDLIVLVFLIMGLICSITIVESSWDTYYKTLPFLSKGISILSFPVGALISIVHLIRLLATRNGASSGEIATQADAGEF